MKTKTIITELNQEDLVTLLSTIEGSSWLDCDTTDREEVDINEGDCIEDIMAKCLLAGKEIACIDYYAEGKIYGDKKNAVISDDGDESACYLITLDDIKEGLQKCADGGLDDGGQWLNECFTHLLMGGYDLDLPEAEALMQVIMFGELIYG